MYGQTDSIVVSVQIGVDEDLNPFGAGYFLRETYDSFGRRIKLEYSSNPPHYYPGDQEVFQYDQNGRMVLKELYNVDAFGNRTRILGITWQYDSNGFLTYYNYNSAWNKDSIVYFRDAQGRDTLSVEYNDSQASPFRKNVSTYYNTNPASWQVEEFLFDAVTSVWLPQELHKYSNTSFDSLFTDSIYRYQTSLSSYLISKVKVNYYDNTNSRIRIETYYNNSVQLIPSECEKWNYDPSSHLLTGHTLSYDSCGSNNSYRWEVWNYDSSGRLIYSKSESDATGCPFNIINDETYYYYDSMGFLSYKKSFNQVLSSWCNVSASRIYRQYLYAGKGVWGATIVAPQKNLTKCEGLNSIVYSLMINEPQDAVSNWSKDGLFSGTGSSFSFSLKMNERIELNAYSPSANSSVNPPFVVMSVQGMGAYPILYNGSPDDIEKCADNYLKLVSNSLYLKDFNWYLNGSLIAASSGSSEVMVVAPGTYRCESVFTAAPNCAHVDEIKLEDVSPNPMLELSGTGISNRKNVLRDVNAEPGSLYKWFKNGAEINGVHDDNINIGGSGTYYCQATNLKNCTSQSPNIQVNLFNSVSENDGVWIMNPIRDHQLQVSFDSEIWPPDQTCQWRITDDDGRVIETGYLKQQNLIVNLPSAVDFCFFNIIRDNKVELSKKIIVLD